MKSTIVSSTTYRVPCYYLQGYALHLVSGPNDSSILIQACKNEGSFSLNIKLFLQIVKPCQCCFALSQGYMIAGIREYEDGLLPFIRTLHQDSNLDDYVKKKVYCGNSDFWMSTSKNSNNWIIYFLNSASFKSFHWISFPKAALFCENNPELIKKTGVFLVSLLFFCWFFLLKYPRISLDFFLGERAIKMASRVYQMVFWAQQFIERGQQKLCPGFFQTVSQEVSVLLRMTHKLLRIRNYIWLRIVLKRKQLEIYNCRDFVVRKWKARKYHCWMQNYQNESNELFADKNKITVTPKSLALGRLYVHQNSLCAGYRRQECQNPAFLCQKEGSFAPPNSDANISSSTTPIQNFNVKIFQGEWRIARKYQNEGILKKPFESMLLKDSKDINPMKNWSEAKKRGESWKLNFSSRSYSLSLWNHGNWCCIKKNKVFFCFFLFEIHFCNCIWDDVMNIWIFFI